MDLQKFILENIEPLIEDWVSFARTLPGCSDLPTELLRDDAAAMLEAIAADIPLAQTASQQLAKSHGRAPRLSALDTGAEVHGADRFARGFGLGARVAEFRALRASVLRKWTEKCGPASVEMLEQLTRFNEGIDQAIAESVERFVAETRDREQADARRLQEEAEALREQERRARRSDKRLHAALLEARMVFWEWNPEGDRVSASPTIHGLLGLVPGHELTSIQQRLELMHPDDRESQQALVGAARARGQGWNARFRVIRPSGGTLWLEERATAVTGEDGKTLITGLVWDITDRVSAEDALREADRRKDRFLATLAHELRNPLAPIRQAAALARLESVAPAQVRWSVEVIDRQATKMALLLDDLLDVSRITRGRLDLHPRHVDAAEVINSAIETVSPLLDERRQDLRIEFPPDPIWLNADPLRLSQVIANLLTNAARYSEPGSKIRVVASRQGSGAQLSVSDEGIGIPADQLDVVFEMFGQGSAGADRRQGGLGVGLALARGLVELHGGSLEARSEGPGRGAEFVVRLPVAARLDPPSLAQTALPRPAEPAERILVVDDNIDAADSLAAVLRVRGHEVRTAYGGQSGLDEASQFRPDLVLLDLGMPHMDGFEVARRIRLLERGAEITLVAVSGWGQPADGERAKAAGFDFHLTKPMEEAQLQPAFVEARRRRSGG